MFKLKYDKICDTLYSNTSLASKWLAPQMSICKIHPPSIEERILIIIIIIPDDFGSRQTDSSFGFWARPRMVELLFLENP